MKTIHKQVLKVTDEQRITLPVCYNIRLIDVQNGDICIWYEFDKDEEKTLERTICFYGTGQDMDIKQSVFLKSIVHGHYVWHIYMKL